MSVGSELDVDMQDLVRVFTHGDGYDLLKSEPCSDAWADNAGDVMAALLALGWLPPTYAAHVKAKVKQAFEAVEDDEAFAALRSAAGVLEVELADPFADVKVALTTPAMLAALGKVA